MASQTTTNGVLDSEKEVREIQELFKGRYPKDVIHDLLTYFHGDRTATVDHLFKGHISKDDDQCDELKALNVRLSSLDIQDESVAHLDKKIESTVRQFACAGCDRVWWQRVPVRKQVSKCKVCQQRFDPIPREEEYGWAEYICDCGHKFSGYGQINKTTSECYKCRASVLTKRIKPQGRRTTKKTDSSHQCNAADCFACEQGKVDKKAVCVHPRTRAKRGKQVVVASPPHTSTGSTVDTFLPQDLGVLSDEERVVSDDEERLRPIPENK